jgi:hypothetical protein
LAQLDPTEVEWSNILRQTVHYFHTDKRTITSVKKLLLDEFKKIKLASITFNVRDANLSHHQIEISSHKITTLLWEMMMTAFETTYSCGNRELKLESRGVAKPLKRLATQCLPKEFIKNLINEVHHTTDKAGSLFQKRSINS